ncbi:MAG: SRPBCC family protein [Actinomycetes bacterium]
MPTLTETVAVTAPAQVTWEAVTDWPAQGAWMLGTTVWTVDPTPGVGQRIEALTGVRRPRRLGVLETMTVTEWDPPQRCVVQHTGRVVRGLGVLEVDDLGDGRSLLRWTEELELPFGAVGRLLWPVVRPAFRQGVQVSLQRFAGWVERGRR